ncbi:MAG: protein phosphatase 2C domain-containing protein [Salinibacterium sp.]|nr:protein phosphatase 2C domain-containing protein [Salinibacterium sp.]
MTEIGVGVSRRVVLDDSAGAPNLSVSWAAATDTGHRRAVNEDSFVVTWPIFAVADGMGGHSAGDLASAAVVTRLAELGTGEFVAVGDIVLALERATDDIETAAEGSALGVGTTVSGAAVVIEHGVPTFAVFNIGDSRVYRFSRNELRQVTVDHSVVQELVDSGVLTPEEAQNHPDSNVITRAVGFNAQPSPDYWMIPMSAGMRLVICSDGLTKELDAERIRLHLAAGLSPEHTAAALVDAALAAGGRDNVTVVIIDVVETASS